MKEKVLHAKKSLTWDGIPLNKSGGKLFLKAGRKDEIILNCVHGTPPSAFHTEFAKPAWKLRLSPGGLFCTAKWCAKPASLANWYSFQVAVMMFRSTARSRSAWRQSMFEKTRCQYFWGEGNQPGPLRVTFKFITAIQRFNTEGNKHLCRFLGFFFSPAAKDWTYFPLSHWAPFSTVLHQVPSWCCWEFRDFQPSIAESQ